MARIEKRGPQHERRGFECGTPELDRFLIQFATQHDERGYGKTYVATEDSPKVLGFYTLAAGSVGFEQASAEILRKLPRHPMPVVHLGRLAVALEAQGQGLGALLLLDALKRSLLVGDQLGVHAVEAVAKDEKARTFYARFRLHSFGRRSSAPVPPGEDDPKARPITSS